MRNAQTARHALRWAFLVAGFTLVTNTALAAPILSPGPAQDTVQENVPIEDASTTHVFHFEDVPANQHVPLTRAVFDSGGYQLFDTAGETIVVPFARKNLYVMKFALSPNDTLYFVNDNGVPILYVPRNGYLENATVAGAKWYPFSDNFHPTTPVFFGIAPSYSEFIDTGWYPDTVLYGGYYGEHAFSSGGAFTPSSGLTLFANNRPYYSWQDYRQYVFLNPSPYRFNYSYRPIYRIGPRNGQIFQGCVRYSDSPNIPVRPPVFSDSGPRFNHNKDREDAGIRYFPRDRDKNGLRDRDSGILGNHPFNNNRPDSPDSSPRFTGRPNFIENRDRAPGPVFGRPSDTSRPTSNSRPSGNDRPSGTSRPPGRPTPSDELRKENNRRDRGRTPGGSRSGARSGRSSR